MNEFGRLQSFDQILGARTFLRLHIFSLLDLTQERKAKSQLSTSHQCVMKLELVTSVRSACIAGTIQIHPNAHARNNKSQ